METKTILTKFFDIVDQFDRNLYGKRMQYFMWGTISVLIISPFLDWILEVPHDRLTYLTTFIFLIFIITMILAWLGSWRDDEGNWTWKRAKSRLQTYYEMMKDASVETKTNSLDETLYIVGRTLFFSSLVWKAFQNLSVFVRKPLESLTGSYFSDMREFEKMTNKFYWIMLLAGVAIIYYLYRKNEQILSRVKNEIRQLFGGKSAVGEKYFNEIARIDVRSTTELVINSRYDEHVKLITTQNKSSLFNDFVNALQNWNPRNCYYEYEFQEKLIRYLRKVMPDATIETERPIGLVTDGNRGRADIVINDTILIEMKRDTSAGAVQRAKGQMMQYSDIWKDKGPVILLLCDYEYEHAKVSFASTMSDLIRLERSALTIVAKPI
jgi:hypothetical protein